MTQDPEDKPDGVEDASLAEVLRSLARAPAWPSAGPGAPPLAGRFALEARFAAGGMGAIYRARDLESGALVAVKLMDGDVANTARFAREAAALASLRHPAIVRHVAHGVTAENRPYLVMEWLEGADLKATLQRGPLGIAETLALAVTAADALGEAHRHGMIHRDIKPANLFLVDGDPHKLKLVDFGIVRLAHADRAATMTSTGVVVGTPRYMSPEQVRATKEIGPGSDVFALGAVLYECVTGRAAFFGDDVLTLALKIVLEDPPRASSLRSDLPRELEELIHAMLAKAPAARPRDGDALSERLASLGASARVTPGASARVEFDAPRRAVADWSGERHLVAIALARASSEKRASATGAGAPEERAREIAAISACVAEHRARAELLDDGTLAVAITGATVPTDLAGLAARCALSLRDLLPGVTIALAIGRGDASLASPSDDALTRATALLRRLERSAAAGGSTPGVHLDDLTASLLDGRFVVADLCLESMKDDARPMALRRTLLGRPSACVGRERDLAMLRDYYDECVGEPRSRAVIITAAAGVGKSRLAAEFVEQLGRVTPPASVWVARGEPMRAGSPFGLLAPLVQSVAGTHHGEPLAVRQEKLERRIARSVPKAKLAHVVTYIAELAGAPFPDDALPGLAAARRDALMMGEHARRAFTTWLAHECDERPLVIVIEDLHWGDAPTVAFLGAALRDLDQRPLLILALARPEVDDLFPKLWAEPGAQALRLGPLARRPSEALVRQALGDDVEQSTVDRVIALAQGNAFFLEEIVRAIADGNREGLPETVLAMVGARLQRLPDAARRVLRAASVFGEALWSDGVAALLGDGGVRTLDPALEVLSSAELVTRMPESRFPRCTEYAFRHALVRDAAYAMLTDSDRALGHLRAAAWLDAEGEDQSAVLAAHYERGHDAAAAARCYGRASAQAVAANDFAKALEHADKALSLGLSDRASLRALHRGRGRAYGASSRFAEASVAFEQALALADDDEQKVEVLVELAESREMALDARGMIEAAETALRLAESTGRNDLAATALVGIAGSQIVKGELNEAVEKLMSARGKSDKFDAGLNLYLTTSLYWAGRLEESLTLADQTLSLTRRSSDIKRLIIALPGFGLALAARGRHAEAFALFDEAKALATTHRARAMFARSMAMSVGPHIEVYDADEAERIAHEAREIARSVKWTPPVVSNGIDLLLGYARRGEPGRADSLLPELLREAETVRDWHGWLWQIRLRHVQGELALARGDANACIAWAEGALEANAVPRRPRYRGRALALRGRAKAKLGRTHDAIADLGAAMDAVRPTGDLPMLVEIGAELLRLAGDDALAKELRAAVDALAFSLPERMRGVFLAAEPVRRILGGR